MKLKKEVKKKQWRQDSALKLNSNIHIISIYLKNGKRPFIILILKYRVSRVF
jgi:hypothetical protein